MMLMGQMPLNSNDILEEVRLKIPAHLMVQHQYQGHGKLLYIPQVMMEIIKKGLYGQIQDLQTMVMER